MSKIVLGNDSEGRQVKIDIDTLLSTRLLIQANSGGGKSWAIRRLAEQSFGKVQQIIIDPEGEFSTLREKLGFVLVGAGGETPATVRSAAILAHRLLELNASAVCDIYELKSSERHVWVKTFLDALINAPKRLWQPALIIVDEAHVYCPEKGQGESEAKDAMTDLATRGRKRQFCPIFATQRLGKLSKNVSSELLNRMVGPTFEDVDVKRAAELLGIPLNEQREFFRERRVAEPGNFYAIGRAIAKEIVRFNVGEIGTSHGTTAKSLKAGPPPAPESVAKLLPQLADLPKEAEKKAVTEAELRQEIQKLKQELRQRPTETKQIVEEKIVEVPVLRSEQIAELTDAVKEVQAVAGLIASALAAVRKAPTMPSRQTPRPLPQRVAAPVPVPYHGNGDGEFTGPERKILRALSELLSIGKEQPPKNMVAAWAGYSPLGGAFGNPIGALRSKGLIDYPQPGTVTLTESGRSVIGVADAPDQEEIWRRIEATCTGPEQKILRALLDNAGQEPMAKEELAEKAGYSPIGGAFGNPIGALRTKGLLDYPRQGTVQAADWLFI